MRGLAAKVSIYAGIVVALMCIAFGLFAYYSGSAAVLAEVEQALTQQAGKRSNLWRAPLKAIFLF